MNLISTFFNTSIRNKLIIIALSVTFIAIISVFILVLSMHFQHLRADMTEHMEMNARLISQYTIRPLNYGFREEAEQILSKLSAISYIHSSAIYDTEGQVFAYFRAAPELKDIPEDHRTPRTYYSSDFIEVLNPVYDNEEYFGLVHLRASKSIITDKMAGFTFYLSFIALFTLAVAFALAYRLQHIISRPIMKLEEFTRQITENKAIDHNFEFEKDRKDEIGSLYRSFSHMINDINLERKEKDRVLEELKSSESRYREIYNAPNEAIFLIDPTSGNILDVNLAVLKMFGIKQVEMVKYQAFHDFSSDKEPFTQEDFLRHIVKTEEDGAQTLDWHARRNDGTLFWVEMSLKSVLLAGEMKIIAILRDITRRLKIEQDLARFALVIEQAEEEVIITDLNGNIQYVNPAFEKILGYKKEEVLDRNPRFLKSGEHDKFFYQDLWNTIVRGETWSGILINRRKDGQLIEEDATISPIYNVEHQCIGYVSIKRDITERKLLLDQLRQSQKMEAVGTLAGGIAHDFNNILTAIMGYNELLLMQIDRDSNIYEGVREIQKAGERAKDLVAQILSFSRKTKQEKSPVQLNYILKEVAKLLRSSIPADIEIITRIHSDKYIHADATQMHQVIMNLCTNAYQAMKEDGGKLILELDEVSLDDKHKLIELNEDMEAGDFLKFTVSDTGIGIDSKVLEKIFEPYFSTKEPGEGTGLGLAVVHGIIKSYHGHISVSSELGKGTTFTIYIPEYVSQLGPGKHKVQSEVQLSGEEKILFVDDEQNIRNLGRISLSKHGYGVEMCSNGKEGLQLFKRDPSKFDLVISDMTMPEMSGSNMAREMLAIRPDIPIIIISGYSNELSGKSLKELGVKKYLVKPIKMSYMIEVVREVIDDIKKQDNN